jgi:hypothetical protein
MDQGLRQESGDEVEKKQSDMLWVYTTLCRLAGFDRAEADCYPSYRL